MPPRFSETAQGVSFRVRLTPRGGRDRVDGWAEGPDGPHLKARVAAPPVDEAANKALVNLLARTLGVGRSSVAITAGTTARVKTVAVAGDPADLSRSLDRLDA